MLQEGSFPNLADSRTHVTLFVGVLCKAMISHAKPVNFQHKDMTRACFAFRIWKQDRVALAG